MQQTCDEGIPCTGRGLAFPRDCGLSAYTWITCRVHAACAHQQIPVFLSFFFLPLNATGQSKQYQVSVCDWAELLESHKVAKADLAQRGARACH